MKKSDPKVTYVHEYNLTCTGQTEIIPCDDTDDIPYLSFDFKSIAEINGMHKNAIADVLAICEEYGELQEVLLRGKFGGRKRELWLVDQSNEKVFSINLDLLLECEI